MSSERNKPRWDHLRSGDETRPSLHSKEIDERAAEVRDHCPHDPWDSRLPKTLVKSLDFLSASSLRTNDLSRQAGASAGT